jgi:hypothetical protein
MNRSDAIKLRAECQRAILSVLSKPRDSHELVTSTDISKVIGYSVALIGKQMAVMGFNKKVDPIDKLHKWIVQPIVEFPKPKRTQYYYDTVNKHKLKIEGAEIRSKIDRLPKGVIYTVEQLAVYVGAKRYGVVVKQLHRLNAELVETTRHIKSNRYKLI